MTKQTNITRLLNAAEEGRAGAMDELMSSVYADLERIAERHLAQRFGPGLPGVTLEPAALVNESFLRLIKQKKRFGDRGQFFAIATKVMLRVLTDYQRQRGAVRRGGDRGRITLNLDVHSPVGAAEQDGGIEVECLATALEELEALDERKADVVKLRVVWGLKMEEITDSLGVSLATVERDWSFSRAWLARKAAALQEPPGPSSPAPRPDS